MTTEAFQLNHLFKKIKSYQRKRNCTVQDACSFYVHNSQN